ncbi:MULTISPECIES: ABC transporter substrate-binding protein [Methylobacterium]|uniref:ABC transporter substrate-binding protein n=1 Tax=Methylobacterium TaxID=407 RepID=UPI0013ECF1F4|nr:ABC transporter substrate-binding protein [Methylobacterium sp. DB0501]NGM34129.1 ABC transporter substrate-binding protein [Methylobacterium sp. DB0501]
MRRQPRHRSIGLAAFLAAVLGIAAGSAASAQEPLKIGLLTDMSGFIVDYSGPGSVVAAKLAIEDYGGKALGRPVVLLQGDHLNKPDVGVSMAREWYDGGVRAIFDIGITTVALGVQNLAREKDRIVVFGSTGSPDITGSACSPNGIAWTHNSYTQSLGAVRALAAENAKSWFFLTVDYAYGRHVQRDTTAMVTALGGHVLGAVAHPIDTRDFSSFLLRAQASQADVIGLATTTAHAANVIKQADEFGIRAGGQKIAPLSFSLHDVKGLGLTSAQGLIVTEAYYWDLNDATRAFADRYKSRFGKMPNMVQAGMYGAVLHYLKAVDKAGTDDTTKVLAAMRSLPINDFMTKDGRIREDGRVMRDQYVFRVKSPSESKSEWDLYSFIERLPAEVAFPSAEAKTCPLMKG